MTIPNKYNFSGEPAIASYNYTDIINGFGYATLYPLVTETNGGKDYFISPTALASAGTERLDASTTPGTDYTFNSSTFNSPRILKGTALASGYLNYTTTSDTVIKIKFQKVSGATVTDVSSQITSQSAGSPQPFLMKIPLTTTHFKIGDSLRMVATVIGHSSGNVPVYSTSNSFVLKVPFDIDL
jgi:hypothetical protein